MVNGLCVKTLVLSKASLLKKNLKKINYIIVVKKLFFISVHQNDPKHLKNFNFKLKKKQNFTQLFRTQ